MSGLLDSHDCATRKGYRSVYLSMSAEVKLGIEAEDAMAQGHDVEWGENRGHKGAGCLFCHIHAGKAVPSSSGTLLGENPCSQGSPLLVILQMWNVPLPWGASIVLKI